MSNFFHQKQPLILASSSKIRAQLLETLGLDFLVIPSKCDEDHIKNQDFSNILDLGFALAAAKALEISNHYSEHFILAADQLCVIDDKILGKPHTHDKALEHLHLLNGKKHQQIVCMCIAYNNKIVWQHHEIAYLTLNQLNDATIERYLRHEQPYNSCGAYHFETQGRWLFKQIEGYEDTILGLPLIPLTNALIELELIKL